LDLSNNILSGTIPEDIGKMTYMNFLILNGNNLTGTIPSQWKQKDMGENK